jgi:hypothetical protein
MSVGFAQALDVDLSLTVEDRLTCMLCDGEAVMVGIIGTPCGCPQTLCLPHYERERPKWWPGDILWCYLCIQTDDGPGPFIRWEKA